MRNTFVKTREYNGRQGAVYLSGRNLGIFNLSSSFSLLGRVRELYKFYKSWKHRKIQENHKNLLKNGKFRKFLKNSGKSKNSGIFEVQKIFRIQKSKKTLENLGNLEKT